MKKHIFQDEDPETRLQLLQDNADKVVDNFKFTKPLTPIELDDFREQFAERHIELSRDKSELKAEVDRRKAEMKPTENEIARLQDAIHSRSIEIEDTAFLFPDYDTNEMGYYDSMGELIMSRRLRPEERQTNIHSINRRAI